MPHCCPEPLTFLVESFCQSFDNQKSGDTLLSLKMKGKVLESILIQWFYKGMKEFSCLAKGKSDWQKLQGLCRKISPQLVKRCLDIRRRVLGFWITQTMMLWNVMWQSRVRSGIPASWLAQPCVWILLSLFPAMWAWASYVASVFSSIEWDANASPIRIDFIIWFTWANISKPFKFLLHEGNQVNGGFFCYSVVSNHLPQLK